MSSSYLANMQDSNERTLVREKAWQWHLLAVLFKIVQPVCPKELASKSRTLTADYVHHMCSISGSPICLTGNGFVMMSNLPILAFGQFARMVFVGYVVPRGIRILERKRSLDGDLKTYFRKRKGPRIEDVVSSTAKRRLSFPCPDGIIRGTSGAGEEFDFAILNKEKTMISLPLKFRDEVSSCALTNIGPIEVNSDVMVSEIMHREAPLDCLFDSRNDSNIPNLLKAERPMACKSDLNTDFSICRFENPVHYEESRIGKIEFQNERGATAICSLEIDNQLNNSPKDAIIHHSCARETPMSQLFVNGMTNPEIIEKNGELIDEGASGRNMKICDPVPVEKAANIGDALSKGLELAKPVNNLSMVKDQTRKVEMQGTFPSPEHSNAQKQPMTDALPPQQRVPLESLDYNKVVKSPKLLVQFMKQKLNHSYKCKENVKENLVNNIVISPKNQLERKALPHFESFIIEKEEGSGGYGTVYRARRKNDGKRFAIKCPHATAHKIHVHNELKMLERFGGRNFIIKYEGTFRRENNELFVLEHVEHDQPEVLKREINIFQLRWYGYCMFRTLACLHKQGVVHRDVKPGYFLFSQKLSKGYLIDFNLAMDLQQKYTTGRKSKFSLDRSFECIPHSNAASQAKDNKRLRGKFVADNPGETVNSKLTVEPKHMKRRANTGSCMAFPDLGGQKIFRSQDADGLGITSIKDTSTRTLSAERVREPLPNLGRKELISLLQDTMQSEPQDSAKIPISQRQKAVVPPSKMDDKFIYTSPMPLHSTGVAVPGSGLSKSKEDGKYKNEGPCVGTKGFRAPEVLFRSPYQSTKVDIWSAGVTLLYLMVGRTPFVGEPEQNIMDIAKIRGSEGLWEVAKLHNCETSFPVELFDIRYLPSVDLQNWCKLNTKRPDFYNVIPRSLFDLVDKCLTINPRQRISAEEALKHKFFAPCHESLRKQRMLRRGVSLDISGDKSGNHTMTVS